jgi:hypothetical protein
VEFLSCVSHIDKGVTILFNYCLAHVSHGDSETRILKWFGYTASGVAQLPAIVLRFTNKSRISAEKTPALYS